MERFVRRLLLVYPLLMLLCGIGYAKYDTYQIDGDAISFMDIADGLRAHHWHIAVNAYWNPAYAAALAMGQIIFHPSRWNELQVYCYVNFVIYLAAIAACLFFVNGLVKLRRLHGGAATAALSPNALALASLALLLFSFQRELSLAKVRADALLLVLFLIAAGILLRLQARGRFYHWPLLGAVLGLAYLTKSFAFLPTAFLLLACFVFGLTRKDGSRNRILLGSALAGIVFAAVAGPFILAITKQYGHPTTGDSARMNYSFFIDHTPRWHEWHHHDLGHAGGTFVHPEIVLSSDPDVYSYANHPVGTYPLWFDPAYFTSGLTPHVWMKGHLLRLLRCTELLVRFLLGHPEFFMLLLTLFAVGASLRQTRASWMLWVPTAGWGFLMLAIYFPIDLQDRYLTGMLLLIILPILAALRRPAEGHTGHAASAAAVLLALLAIAGSINTLAEARREQSINGYPRGSYSKQIYPAAQGLATLGVRPGDAIACMGDQACYVDQYWARLAGTQILAEVEVPNSGDPAAFWQSGDNSQRIITTLASQPVKGIVAFFPAVATQPAGWRQLGKSDYYVYMLK